MVKGRKRNPLWDHVRVTLDRGVIEKTLEDGSKKTVNKQHPDVKCLYCEHEITNANIKEKVVPHLMCCPLAPPLLKDRISTYAKPTTTPPKPKRPPTTPNDTTPRKSPRLNKAGVTGNSASPSVIQKLEFGTASFESQARFELDLAYLIHAMGLPFATVEHPQFKTFLGRYASAFKIPSRQDIGGVLLDKVYNEERRKVIKVLEQETNVSIATDGWTDQNNEHVVNFVVTSPHIRPLFWSSTRTEDDANTGENLASSLADAIGSIEKVAGKDKVCSVVTDNAPNALKSSRLVTEAKPTVVSHGCTAHALNLLAGDVLSADFFKEIVDSAVMVVKFCKKRSALLSRFRKVQRRIIPASANRRALYLPVLTRWYSTERCLRSLSGNRAVLRELFRDDQFLSRFQSSKLAKVRQTINDSVFWQRVEAAVMFSEPISKAIAEMEKDSSTASMVHQVFHNLVEHDAYTFAVEGVDDSVRHDIVTSIKNRWEFARSSIVDVACLLDPRIPVSCFPTSTLQGASDSAILLAKKLGIRGKALEEFETELYRFIRVKGGGVLLDPNSSKPPTTWWFMSDYEILKGFAMRVLSVPGPTASSERSWSIHAFIHNKRRNRLSGDKIQKLAFIYANVGTKEPATTNFYTQRQEWSLIENPEADEFELDPPNSAGSDV